MKTIVLRKELNASRLAYHLWLFFNNLNLTKIHIDKIVLTLRNNQEFILLEDINVDKSNIQEVKTVKKLNR